MKPDLLFATQNVVPDGGGLLFMASDPPGQKISRLKVANDVASKYHLAAARKILSAGHSS